MVLFANSPSFSQEAPATKKFSGNPFIVKGVDVDITDESAVAAREKAFRKAQEKSVPMLYSQLEDMGYNTSRLKSQSSSVIANAMRDFEISNEKISSVRYKARFQLNYSQSALEPYLTKSSGTSYSTGGYSNPGYENPYQGYGYNDYNRQPVQAQNASNTVNNKTGKTVVLPFLQVGTAPLKLWDGYNPWMDVWARNAPSDVIIPIGDLADIGDIKDSEALTYNPQSMQNLVQRYDADRAIVLLSTYTGAPLPTTLANAATGQLNVSVYDTASGKPVFINQATLAPQNGEDFEVFLNRGVERSLTIVETLPEPGQVAVNRNVPERQPNNSVVPQNPGGKVYSTSNAGAGPVSAIKARVDYSSLNEWIATQRKIKQTPGVSSLQILALRAKQADILITHSGSVDSVASSLMQNGIGLRADAGQGMYSVYSSGAGQRAYR
ncbi:MAG: hypothetical protein CL565_04830 [Alphaproteobacteria bacterium]|nr:hypothetical protein [Alphaproteobacteria bacterium]